MKETFKQFLKRVKKANNIIELKHQYRRERKEASILKSKQNARKKSLEVLLAKYDLTFESLSQLIDIQCGKCAICLEPSNLVVDHDHSTGKVRGLLCAKCNSILGFAKDKQSILISAADYLKTTTITTGG